MTQASLPTDGQSGAARPVMQRGYTRCRYGQLHYMMGGPVGPVAGPPLVLLHQNPSSILEYSEFAEEMAKDRLVIAFDTPGNGMSDRPPAPPSMTDYAGAFADGLDALGVVPAHGKVDVLGFHTGTYFAAELALGRPDLVGRVILSGVPFRPADQRATRLEAALKPMVLTEDGAAVYDYVKKMWDFSVTIRNPASPLERAAEIFIDRLRPLQRNAWPYIAVWSYDAEDRLPQIKQPVIVLQPHEPLLEHSRAAAALIDGARWVEFPHLDIDVFDLGKADYAREIRAWMA